MPTVSKVSAFFLEYPLIEELTVNFYRYEVLQNYTADLYKMNQKILMDERQTKKNSKDTK